jgi:glucosyl-dolichyl phosphate glucuronosyltransferase
LFGIEAFKNVIMGDSVIPFSVVIATHGPATYLAKVLEGLAAQTYRDFEVIIVDNNERPAVKVDTLPGPLCHLEVIHESRVGLSIARNAGVARARGRYVAFLDDDSVPAPTWLAELSAGIKRYGAAVAGGTVRLTLPHNEPSWLAPEMRSLLSELLYDGQDIADVGEDQYIVGANMCVAKELFGSVGGFDHSFGRVGAVLRSSEELELCRRAQKAGYRVSFISQAVVWHSIPSRRLRKSYLLSRAYWQGRSDGLLEVRHGRPATFGVRNNRKNLTTLFRAVFKSICLGGEARRFPRYLNVVREYGYCLQYASLTLPLLKPEARK